MSTDLHISTTGQTFSFRPAGSPLEEREAIFSAFRYGSAPDAVLVTYGIQGAGYWRALGEHWEEIGRGCCAVMGYVFQRHTAIYRRALRGRATVEVLHSGHPYGVDGPLMDWVVVRPIRGDDA